MSRKNQEFLRRRELKLRDTRNQNDRTSNRLNYREPTIYSLGYLEQVEAYYSGGSYDGPNSWLSYDG